MLVNTVPHALDSDLDVVCLGTDCREWIKPHYIATSDTESERNGRCVGDGEDLAVLVVLHHRLELNAGKEEILKKLLVTGYVSECIQQV